MTDLRTRVTQAMALGRPRLVLDWAAASGPSFDADPYLLLQWGGAAALVDDLEVAEERYRRARDHAAASDEQRAYADQQLAWIEAEWQRLSAVEGGRLRAKSAIAVGVLLSACVVGAILVVGRRMRVQDGTRY